MWIDIDDGGLLSSAKKLLFNDGLVPTRGAKSFFRLNTRGRTTVVPVDISETQQLEARHEEKQLPESTALGPLDDCTSTDAQDLRERGPLLS